MASFDDDPVVSIKRTHIPSKLHRKGFSWSIDYLKVVECDNIGRGCTVGVSVETVTQVHIYKSVT